jgi:hypothetical protein
MRRKTVFGFELDDGAYKIVAVGQPEIRPNNPGAIDGYRVSVRITRIDGHPVVPNTQIFRLPPSALFSDLDSALDEGERLARQAIEGGFATA